MTTIAITAFAIGLILIYRFRGNISRAITRYFSLIPKEDDIVGHKPGRFHDVFFNTVFLLLGYVAKCDGHVHEVELRLSDTYMEKMGLTAARKVEALTLFKKGSEAQFIPQAALLEFLKMAKKMPELIEILLVYLANLARIDGILYKSEISTLQAVGKLLGFTSYAYEHLLKMIASQNKFADNLSHESDYINANQYTKYRNAELATSYQALGVTATASDAEVKKAYRKLMSQYHPDKLTGQGMPDFMVKASSVHFQKIQAAYDYIQKSKVL